MEGILDKTLYFPSEETKSLRGNRPGRGLADRELRTEVNWSLNTWSPVTKADSRDIYKIIQHF